VLNGTIVESKPEEKRRNNSRASEAHVTQSSEKGVAKAANE